MPRKTVELPLFVKAQLHQLAEQRRLKELAHRSGIPYPTLHRAKGRGEIWEKHYPRLVAALPGGDPNEVARWAVEVGTKLDEIFRAMQDPLKTGLRIHERVVEIAISPKRILSAMIFERAITRIGGIQRLLTAFGGVLEFEEKEWADFQAKLEELLPKLEDMDFQQARQATRCLGNALRKARQRGRERFPFSDPFGVVSLTTAIPPSRLGEILIGKGITFDELNALADFLCVPPHDLLVLSQHGLRFFREAWREVNEALRQGVKYREERKRLEEQREALNRLREMLNLEL